MISLLDFRPSFGYITLSRSLEGRDLETHLITERVRFLRAGLVTPLPGGPGSANKCTQFAQMQTAMPAGTTTGARSAPLKRAATKAEASPPPHRAKHSSGRVGAFGRSGKRRREAPEGERVPPDALPRPGIGRRQRLLVLRGNGWMRLSALRLPRLVRGPILRAWWQQSSDANAPRERFCFSPFPASDRNRGEGVRRENECVRSRWAAQWSEKSTKALPNAGERSPPCGRPTCRAERSRDILPIGPSNR